ncbi:MAG TPA: alkaline phosphatase family protein [Terriglobales bacterium]|nr:alkaline phosphatase family protein [Terriglobales bacterium]
MEPGREGSTHLKKAVWILSGLLLVAGTLLLFSCERARGEWNGDHRLIVLGIDGMDPQLLTRFMQEGKMPNFARLAKEGSFRQLTTSIPPQSPVAWSNMMTGMNAGGHGIFDFIHRDPKTLDLYFSASRVAPPKHALHLGSWVIPLGGGTAEQLRRGEAFWQILDEHHIPNSVFRIPSNFPPVAAKGNTLSGMGTPDLRGTYGTFSFYTDDPTATAGAVEGGQIIPVQVENSQVTAPLIGPENAFRKGSPPATEPFKVSIDPIDPVARIAVQDQEFVLREGEWSGWIPVEFQLIPFFGNVKGMCRFYLKQAHPRFQLYVSPINIDPANPALPISTPPSYSRELEEEVGEFYTQGISEDTKALSNGVLDDKEFLEQSRTVLAEHRAIFDAEFPKFHKGVFFFYFSSLDLNSHMLWRLTDPKHPEYDAASAAQNGSALEDFYQQMDQVLGEVLPKVDEHTTLLVLSDHGFAPYYRSFNLNTWLMNNGYITLKSGAVADENQPFANVDWSHTRAYGLGLNGLYVNQRGREKEGIVQAGTEADALLKEIREKLLAVRDPQNGLPVITRVDLASEVYQGPYAREGPDALVGYNRGYRAGWKTILGDFPPDVLEDNDNPWSGDHCIDYTLVPGVLLSNRKIPMKTPALTDMAPTILAEFGIPKAKGMIGQSVFQPERAAR